MSTTPTKEQMLKHLRHTVQVAHRAKTFGRHPFGSILVGPDNETVLLEQGNIDTLHHAESTLCHVACKCFMYVMDNSKELKMQPFRDQFLA
jgi:tRNA(Arg) A34 adenosine deaminase TadA